MAARPSRCRAPRRSPARSTAARSTIPWGELDVAGGTLNGVTYVGTLQLTGTSQELYVGPKGLVVEPSLGSNNPGQVNLTGDNAQINFEGTQTFDDAVIDIGNNAGNSFIYTDSTNAALTLGAKLTIDQTGLYAEIQNYGSGSSITNEGTIEAEFAGGTFTISNDAFANDGTIDAANGDKVNITSTLTNYSANTLTGGTFEADAGSEIDMTTSGVIETDQADIILSGTGSIQSGNTGNNQSPESLAASLTTIGASGELVLKGGAVFATANAFTNQGTLDLQSGTFTDASLSNAVGATLQGYGTVTDALTSNGSIVAQGGRSISRAPSAAPAGSRSTPARRSNSAARILRKWTSRARTPSRSSTTPRVSRGSWPASSSAMRSICRAVCEQRRRRRLDAHGDPRQQEHAELPAHAIPRAAISSRSRATAPAAAC